MGKGRERFITISKKWKRPIVVSIEYTSSTGIELTTSFDDFIAILKDRIGSPLFKFSKVNFDKEIDTIVEEVLQSVKDESKKVI